MNHSGFTAELQERELYNSQETGWCGMNIHQAQILGYLPLLDHAKGNTPWAGQPGGGFSHGGLLSRWKVSVPLVRGMWGVQSPLCPQDEPVRGWVSAQHSPIWITDPGARGVWQQCQATLFMSST